MISDRPLASAAAARQKYSFENHSFRRKQITNLHGDMSQKTVMLSTSLCKHEITLFTRLEGGGGYAVAQLVRALRYKAEGRGFDVRWCHWSFSLTYSFRPHCDPGVDSPLIEMSTRNISRG